jgi:hypothetical protein
MAVSDDTAIYVDAGRPATLNDGAGKLTDCATLQEAVVAWHALPSAQDTGDGQGVRRTRVHRSSDTPPTLWAEAGGVGPSYRSR